MKSGLLWYDGDPRKPIWDKIEEAAQRYYEKFGVRPNTCYVNPAALPSKPIPAQTQDPKQVSHASALHVGTKATILPNHIWLGASDK